MSDPYRACVGLAAAAAARGALIHERDDGQADPRPGEP